MDKKNSHKTVFFVATAFFLSGGCGLVYEVLWTRYLADLMGATSLSQFVVLMVFMGGLSLGAILIGRLVDRGRNGLAYYGWLEVGVGLYAVLFPFLFSKVAGLFIFVGANFEPGSLALLVLKLLIASLLIAVPSVAMGGTLPAVTRYITRSQSGLRRNISLLYGVNSLGAVAGVLAGGFFLVYRYGLSRSMIYVGAFNVCLGVAVLAFIWFSSRNKEFYSEPDNGGYRRREEQADTRIYRPDDVKLAIGAAGVSGFAAMALQIAWIRYFVIMLGATHSAFTIVVAAFIFGIGLGALLVRAKWLGRFPLPSVLVCLFALISTTLGLGLFFYAQLPFETVRLLSVIAHTPYAWPFYQILKFGICFALMLLPSVASGMILPLCVRIVGRGSERVGRDVAVVYAVNTLGALLGIGITSQFLFRMLTLPRTLQVILLIYLAATIFLAFLLKEKGRKRILALSTVLVLVNLIFWRPWSPVQLHLNRVDFSKGSSTYEDFTKVNNEQTIVVEDRQGPDVQVTVMDVFTDKKPFRSMFINGKADATNKQDSSDFATEVLLGHLPVLLHPAPRNAFVLGLGSGITSGEILKFPGMRKVVTAELAAEVFEASKTFAADNGRFWENPRHRMVIDDGKTFLRLSKEKFDVIAMEPTNVWQEGMAGLFSEDFFKLVKSRLADDGIVAQWLHIYELDDLTFNIVLKTFSRIFPVSSVFKVGYGDIILVGYNEQWQFDPLKLEQRFYQPQVLESQKKVGNDNPSALLLREVMSRDNFKEYTAVVQAPVNTENFPVLEKAAEYGRFIKHPITILTGHDSRLDPDGRGLLILDYFKQFGIDKDQLQQLVNSKIIESDKLRESIRFKAIEQLWEGTQDIPAQTLKSFISDPQLAEIITHPTYSMSTDDMTMQEAYNMLQGELLIWQKAASQLWTPRPERLQQLYDRFATGVDRKDAGIVARNTALSLAYGRACGAAIPFFRLAEQAGAMTTESLRPADIVTTFYCELREGDVEKARNWWQIIEMENIPLIDAMIADKATLDIKLGGDQPPPVYGKLPSRW
jgi:predicted membrane-bound spermidine synthase